MKPFVFIFRQAKYPLSEEQKRQRAEEVRAWALKLDGEGHTLEPRILGAENFIAAAEGDSGKATSGVGDPVAAILIVDFASFDEAKKAAENHPGRLYGVSIEVREAFPPPGAPPAR